MMTTSWVEFLSANGMLKSESLNEVSYECESTKDHALAIIQRWQTEFTRPSEARFIAQRAPDCRSVVLPQSSTDLEDKLDHFLPTETFRLALIIDKKELQPDVDLDCSLLVFSDMEAALECVATDSLDRLESVLFPSNRPTVVYLFQGPAFYITNGVLSICSPSTIHRIDPTYLAKAMDSLNDKRRLRNENVRWNDDSRLTPDHLILTGDIGESSPFASFLHSWAARLCVIFLASYTFHLEGGTFISVFTGWREVRFQSRLIRGAKEFDLTSLFNLYNWVYGEKTPDKLGLLQQTISMEINTPQNDAIDLLLERTDDIYRLVQNGFRKYTEKSIREYLQERKQVEDFVKATSADVNQQLGQVTDLMTKNLTGVLTAALGSTLAYYSSTLKHIVPIALYATGAFILLLTLYLSAYSGANVYNITKGYKERIALFRKSFVEDTSNPSGGTKGTTAGPPKGTALQIAEQGVVGRITVFWWFFFVTIMINVLLAIGAGVLAWKLQKIQTPNSVPSATSAVMGSTHQSHTVTNVPSYSSQSGGTKPSTHH